MKNAIVRRQLRILVMVSALTLGVSGAGSAQASAARHGCPAGEIFATNNTAIITDPADPRLKTRLTRFEHEVRGIIHANGARPGASKLLDGVFWSGDLKQATYERSREFDVNKVGREGLHHIAGVIAKQYHQESVLAFRCLPHTSPETDAVEIQAPGVSATRLHDALIANPEARDKLGGGSVTRDGRLILVAPLADLPLARKFTKALGVDWKTAEVRYGDEEFVS
ncbi:hypothetical protein [Streptomyces hiroshimensis]|uniref:Secreted protein n=1 Tax=Streptomyces hiroshimensis TaxID=66424 RepID=A0ABQ2Y8E4_9ACTN|nr:hypothetical protein [Streptomyces hiroshimensis]GGX74850.1 hypothetical protein GCM10010324_20260 [Streptomyces hiroshimensis]